MYFKWNIGTNMTVQHARWCPGLCLLIKYFLPLQHSSFARLKNASIYLWCQSLPNNTPTSMQWFLSPNNTPVDMQWFLSPNTPVAGVEIRIIWPRHFTTAFLLCIMYTEWFYNGIYYSICWLPWLISRAAVGMQWFLSPNTHPQVCNDSCHQTTHL